jgi:hypothetical protein
MSKSKITPVKDRGMVTDEIAAYYKEQTGRELTTRELRLLPYIQYTVMNDGLIRFDRQAVSYEELRLLYSMDAFGLIVLKTKPGAPNIYSLGITNEFWTIINHVLYQTYVIKGVHHAATDSRRSTASSH